MAEFETVLILTFLLGCFSSWIAGKMMRRSEIAVQSAVKQMRSVGTQTLPVPAEIRERSFRENVKVFPTGNKYHRMRCRHVLDRPGTGKVYEPCADCILNSIGLR